MTPETGPQITPSLQPGDKVGYYEVREPIARGGMALVWLGHDRLLDRKVAIKQISDAGAADETARQRFRQEADLHKQVSAGAKHLVEVIDFIEEQRGLFIVMEYVEGASLEQVLGRESGPIEPARALPIILQIALGLHAIHQAGVLHRDLKPSNVLIGEDGVVKLCDFGLASYQHDQDLQTLGTARYMAPELFTDHAADVRSDLYALGMIGYEMLAGRPAFEEAFRAVLRDQRNQALRWMKWHTNARLTAPPLTKLNEHVPEALSEMIGRLMAKDPSQRLASAAQVVEVLKRNFSKEGRTAAAAAPPASTGAGGEAAAPSASSGEPTAALPTPSRMPVILAVMLVVNLLLIGGIFGYYQYRQADEQAAVQRQLAARLREGRRLYDQQQYAEARQVLAGIVEHEAATPGMREAARGGRLLAEARLARQQADAALPQLEFDRAERLYQEAEQLLADAERSGGLADVEMIRQLSRTTADSRAFADIAGDVHADIQAGDYESARQRIADFRELREPVGTEQQILDQLSVRIEDQAERTQLQRLIERADRMVSAGQLDEARALLDDAQRRYNAAVLRDRVEQLNQTIRYERALADARRAQDADNLGEAIRAYQEAQRIRPSDALAQRIAQLRSDLAYRQGRELQRMGDLEGARQKYLEANAVASSDAAQRALEELGRAVDKASLIRAGDTAMAAGDPKQALDHYQQAAEIEDSPEVQHKLNAAKVRLEVARAEEALDRWALEEAAAALDRARAIDPSDPQANRLSSFLDLAREYRALVDAGDEWRSQSRFGKAKEQYLEAKALIEGSEIATDEIEQRIEDAEYNSWIARARVAIEARRWREARAHLRSAETVVGRTTESTAELRRRIEENDPDAS